MGRRVSIGGCIISLATTTPDGPIHPGVTNVDNNAELVTAKVIDRMLSRWANDAVAADACDRSLMSDFQGRNEPIGDTLTIPRRDRHNVTTGVSWSAEERQANFATLSLGPVKKNDSRVNMWLETSYRSPKQEKRRQEDVVSRLIAEVEMDVFAAMGGTDGYWGLVQPYAQDPAPPADATSKEMTAAGHPSTSHPLIKLLTDAEADLGKRAINSDELCALLDLDTKNGLALAGVAAPYQNPIGSDAYSRGLDGNTMRADWQWKKTALSGTQEYPTTAGNVTVSAQPAEGATSITLAAPSAAVIKAGARFTIPGVRAVNEETSEVTTTDQTFVVQADTTGGSATRSVSVQPPFRAADSGDPKRRRTVSKLPSANADVFFGGLDSTEAIDRNAFSGKTTARSFLIVKDTTMLVFVDPSMPTNDVEDAMIRNRDYAIAFATYRYFKGDEAEFRQRIMMRTGQKTVEPEAGLIAGSTPVVT